MFFLIFRLFLNIHTQMDRYPIKLYKLKVFIVLYLLSRELLENSNAMFSCDLWIIGLFRIIQRMPWITKVLTRDQKLMYRALNPVVSLFFCFALMARSTSYDSDLQCKSCERIGMIIYYEAYLTISLFIGFLITIWIVYSRHQMEYQRKTHLIKNFKLDSIPFNQVIAWNQTDRECCICRNEFSNDDILANIYCGHLDHLDCMNEWTRRHKRCPRCQIDLLMDK